MKDLALAAASGYNWSQIEAYAVSLSRCRFKGDKVLLVNNLSSEAMDNLKELGFILIPTPAEQGPHSTRFLHAWNFLRESTISPYRFVIWNDVRDVVFQDDPVDWFKDHWLVDGIIAASECIVYKNDSWGDPNIKAAFRPEIYNWLREEISFCCGTIAGSSAEMQGLLLNIYLVANGASTYPADQAAYNLLVHQAPYGHITFVPKIRDGFALMCGTCVDRPEFFRQYMTENMDELYQGPEGLVYPYVGAKPFCIVHQYDRIAAWRELIEKRYKL